MTLGRCVCVRAVVRIGGPSSVGLQHSRLGPACLLLSPLLLSYWAGESAVRRYPLLHFGVDHANARVTKLPRACLNNMNSTDW
jgi:hypothetical protein